MNRISSVREAGGSEGTVPFVGREKLGRFKFARAYYWAKEPVVVQRLFSDSELGLWSPGALVEKVAGKKVRLKYNVQGVFDYNASASTGAVDTLEKEFREAAELILNHRFYYLQATSLKRELPELLDSLMKPYLIDSRQLLLTCNLWFGGAGCKSPLHYDLPENFLIQTYGRKRVILYPPAAGQYLYPALDDALPHFSRVNVFGTEFSEFPLFTKAQSARREFVIGPGDMLYIPMGWWHAVESLDTAVSVNMWWVSKARMLFRWLLPRLMSKTGRNEIKKAMSIHA